jgi:D-xylose transport system substrate-binding protein
MRYRHVLKLNLLSIALLILTGCVSAPEGGTPNSTTNTGSAGSGVAPGGKVRIGFLMDTLKEERWQRDKELFEQRAKELGAEVSILVANGDDNLQRQQAETMLTRGVDVLVVAPHNGTAAASIVEAAKRQNIPVISYDRLIISPDVTLYVSHQVPVLGEMQARYALEKAPRGNYVLIGGSPTDNNAKILREGQMRILQPAVDRGDIKIVADPFANEWLPEEALKHTENALTQNNNNIAAVVASNDGTAGGAVRALESQGLAGKVLVTGQDADKAALARIAQGTQTMTIYKPIKPLASGAVEAAIKLARREQVPTTETINNGVADVKSLLFEPIVVDKNNLMVPIKDGFHSYDAVFGSLPEGQRPPR